MTRLAFRRKLTFAILATALSVCFLYSGYNILQSQAQMETLLINEHTGMCEYLATSFDVAKAKVGVAYNAELIEQMGTNDEYVVYIRVVKPSGEIYLSTEKNEMGQFVKDLGVYTKETIIREDVYNGENIKTVVSPTNEGYTIWLGFSLHALETAFYEMVLFNILIFLPIACAIVVVSYYISRNMTRPIKKLMDGVQQIGAGNLDVGTHIESKDELGDLGFAFDQMRIDLKKSKNEIEDYSKNLEKKVTERTEELHKSKENLEKTVVDLQKNRYATLNIMRDLKKTVAFREKAERELKESHEMLQAVNSDLERKVEERTIEVEKLLKQKDEFVNQLGHDLKNPLGPLLNLLPILEKDETDLERKKIFDVLNRNTSHIENLVVKTIQLARLNAPSTKLNLEDVGLFSETDDTIKRNRSLFEENNMEIDNRISDKIIIKADKLRLTELFDNLINNAVKYTKGSGTITIDAEQDKDFVTVSVKDTGIGATEEQLSHIFDEFYKADWSRHDFDSSGLGLPICKRIVEKHGGKIWAESEGEGKGTTMFFTLPISSEKQKDKEQQ